MQILLSVSFVLKWLPMHFPYLMSQNFACGCKMSSASQLLFLWQTGSSYPILEVCEFQFWQCRDSSCHVFLRILAVSRLHLIDPSSIEHNSACYIVYPLHLIDNHFGFCVSVHRSVVERIRPQFFTDFHIILHAAQKCGCFEGYIFSGTNRKEVDYRF